MKTRGVIYDAETVYGTGLISVSTRLAFDRTTTRRELQIIGTDLHCKPVRDRHTTGTGHLAAVQWQADHPGDATEYEACLVSKARCSTRPPGADSFGRHSREHQTEYHRAETQPAGQLAGRQ